MRCECVRSLRDILSIDPCFFQLLEQVAHPLYTTCAKDVETARLCKEEGNAAFRASSFQNAVDRYTKVNSLILSKTFLCHLHVFVIFWYIWSSNHWLLFSNPYYPCSSYLWILPLQAIRYNRFATNEDKKNLATLFVNRAAALHVRMAIRYTDYPTYLFSVCLDVFLLFLFVFRSYALPLGYFGNLTCYKLALLQSILIYIKKCKGSKLKLNFGPKSPGLI